MKNINNNQISMKEILENISLENIKRMNNNEKDKNERNERKITLSNYGFIQAGKHMGNLSGLRNSMHRIYNGYLNELTGKQNRQTDEINNQIEETKAKKTNIINQIEHIEKFEIQEINNDVEELKNESEQIRIDAEAGFIDSDFNWVKTILFTLFSTALGISLILFYTSLIYNAAFKNIGDTLSLSTSEDASLLFNTLLDVKSLFTFNNNGILFSYLFSSIFLLMGLLLHAKSNKQKIINKTLAVFGKGVLLIVALGAEIVFAYKIEKNIDEIKTMTLSGYVAANNWQSLLMSVDVLVVIILGFLGYMIWSSALERTFTEWNKRNPKRLASVKLRELSRKINRKQYKIGELRKQISQLQGKINMLDNELEILNGKLNHVFFQPVELEDRLEAFFSGWLKFISNHNELKTMIGEHQNFFLSVKDDLFRNNTSQFKLN